MTIGKDQPLKDDTRPPGRAFGDTLRMTEGDRAFGHAARALRLTINGIAAYLRNGGR